MASRKGALSPLMDHGGRSSIKSGMTTQYVEALQVMNDATMRKACELLLSTRDYSRETDQKGNDDGSSDREKLLQLCSRCQKASKVLEEQEPKLASSMPPAPSLGGASSRLNRGVSALPKLAKKVATSKQGIIPMRRTSHMTRGVIAPGLKKTLKRDHDRKEKSRPLDDASVSSHGSAPSAKKPRHSAPPQESSESATSTESPPQNALSFLAKLNKEPKEETKKRRKNPSRVGRRDSANEP